MPMKIEIREDKVILDGYVNAVERFSKVLKNKSYSFIERIMPKVFQRAIEKNDSIKVLLNHDYDQELANTKDGTAKLYEDNIGLRAIVEVSDPTVIEKAKQNKLRGWSFGFICNKADDEVNENGLHERTVRDIDLIEVSILDDRKIPAYVGTSIEMRDGMARVVEFRDEEVEQEEEPQDNQETSQNLTMMQLKELLNVAYRKSFENGYIEDFDNSFVYGMIDDSGGLYKTPYKVDNGNVTFDTSQQKKVIRGSYIEAREEPEQQPKKEVDKIDYSEYEERLKKLKEETK